jgi:hypothetical protein
VEEYVLFAFPARKAKGILDRNLSTIERCLWEEVSQFKVRYMRVGIVFHKNPLVPPTGIDLVRLRALAGGLRVRGVDAEIVAPVEQDAEIDGTIPVRPLAALNVSDGYDLVKTSYHPSIMLLENFRGPVVARIVRVVDELLPERDEPFRDHLLKCQSVIRERASVLILNNPENEVRWKRLYGETPPVVLIPTGCPAELPESHSNPYRNGEKAVLFLGSLAAPRMVQMLNEAAERLDGVATVHLVGLNKACMYGGDDDCILDRRIVDHGELCEADVWDFVRHASIGLAFATGLHPFDNDVSKILNYLRGGLPVLSEEPIVNNVLVRETGFGKTFPYGDSNSLVQMARDLLKEPPLNRKEEVMRYMAAEHSWDRRVDTYIQLFDRVLSGPLQPDNSPVPNRLPGKDRLNV